MYTLLETLEKKDKIIKNGMQMRCANCEETFCSPFDKLYIAVAGSCYLCDGNELLAKNILENI